MSVRVTWNGEKIKAATEEEFRRRLERAAITLKNAVKEDLSSPSPPRSSPGEAPHKDTGRLRASIAHEVEDKVARVGTNLDYGKFLELGTPKMAARPFLRTAFERMKATIIQIMKGQSSVGGE